MQLSGLLGMHHKEYLPFMIYAEARQPCYSISLLQLFQAYCTLPSIFTQHVLWRKRTKLNSQKAGYHKAKHSLFRTSRAATEDSSCPAEGAVKVSLGHACHMTEDSWWETSQQLKLKYDYGSVSCLNTAIAQNEVLQEDNHTEGMGSHNQQSVILGGLYTPSRWTSHHRLLWSNLGNLSSEAGSCYICKLCCWPQELNTGKSWYHHPDGNYWLLDFEASFGGGLLSQPLLSAFSCLDGG